MRCADREDVFPWGDDIQPRAIGGEGAAQITSSDGTDRQNVVVPRWELIYAILAIITRGCDQDGLRV